MDLSLLIIECDIIPLKLIGGHSIMTNILMPLTQSSLICYVPTALNITLHLHTYLLHAVLIYLELFCLMDHSELLPLTTDYYS